MITYVVTMIIMTFKIASKNDNNDNPNGNNGMETMTTKVTKITILTLITKLATKRVITIMNKGTKR